MHFLELVLYSQSSLYATIYMYFIPAVECYCVHERKLALVSRVGCLLQNVMPQSPSIQLELMKELPGSMDKVLQKATQQKLVEAAQKRKSFMLPRP